MNEPGLYRLIFGSRKAEARRFKRWIFHEVLPTLRRTGRYEMPVAEPTARTSGPKPTAVPMAQMWLAGWLASGPRTAGWTFAEAAKAGITKSSLYRALEGLKGQTFARNDGERCFTMPNMLPLGAEDARSPGEWTRTGPRRNVPPSQPLEPPKALEPCIPVQRIPPQPLLRTKLTMTPQWDSAWGDPGPVDLDIVVMGGNVGLDDVESSSSAEVPELDSGDWIGMGYGILSVYMRVASGIPPKARRPQVTL